MELVHYKPLETIGDYTTGGRGRRPICGSAASHRHSTQNKAMVTCPQCKTGVRRTPALPPLFGNYPSLASLLNNAWPKKFNKGTTAPTSPKVIPAFTRKPSVLSRVKRWFLAMFGGR